MIDGLMEEKKPFELSPTRVQLEMKANKENSSKRRDNHALQKDIYRQRI